MYIGIGYILPKLGDICSDIGYVLPTIGVYILILDIFCQQSGIYSYIGYILPTIGRYMSIMGCLKKHILQPYALQLMTYIPQLLAEYIQYQIYKFKLHDFLNIFIYFPQYICI